MLANPDANVFDKQNPGMLGLSLVAQAGMVGSFVAMSAAQKVQNAFKSVKSSVIPPEEIPSTIKEKSTPHLYKQKENKKMKANILVTQHAKESNDWKLKIIKKAKKSIEISGNYCGGKIFRDTLNTISKKLDKNDKLQVHILSSPELLQSADLSLVDKISKKYPTQFHFLQTKTICSHVFRSGDQAEQLQSRENHVKLVVVDDYYFVAGGTNFEEHLGTIGEDDQSITITSSLYERFVLTASRDMDIVGSGEEISEMLRAQFFDLFSNWLNIMGVNYIGDSFLLKKKSKKQLIEENSQLKQKVLALEDENQILRNKIDDIRYRLLNGLEINNELLSNEYLSFESLSLQENQILDDEIVNSNSSSQIEYKNEEPMIDTSLDDWYQVPSLSNWEYNEDLASSTSDLYGLEHGVVYEFDTHPNLIENVEISSILGSKLYHVDLSKKYESVCSDEYVNAIDSAQFSIRLAHLNVNPAPKIMESILRAVKRGVSVELITTAADTKTTLASHFYAWANRINYLPIFTGESYLENQEQAQQLLCDHVKIYEYAIARTTFHKKLIVVDNSTLLIGSYNLSQKSHHGDDELLIHIHSSDVCSQVNEILNIDISKSNLITTSQALQYYFSWKSRFLSDLQKGRVAKLIG